MQYPDSVYAWELIDGAGMGGSEWLVPGGNGTGIAWFRKRRCESFIAEGIRRIKA